MKLAMCTKFQVNRMNCVESRRGGGPIDPPSRLRVAIFSRRLLGLTTEFFYSFLAVNRTIEKQQGSLMRQSNISREFPLYTPIAWLKLFHDVISCCVICSASYSRKLHSPLQSGKYFVYKCFLSHFSLQKPPGWHH